MGQSEPCRAQLAMISSVVLCACQPLAQLSTILHVTYNAYCTALLLPSWLGRGTSTFSLLTTAFMLGGGPGFPCTLPGPIARFGAASAGFFVEFDMKAAFAARSGRSAVVGLAMRELVSLSRRRAVFESRHTAQRQRLGLPLQGEHFGGGRVARMREWRGEACRRLGGGSNGGNRS